MKKDPLQYSACSLTYGVVGAIANVVPNARASVLVKKASAFQTFHVLNLIRLIDYTSCYAQNENNINWIKGILTVADTTAT